MPYPGSKEVRHATCIADLSVRGMMSKTVNDPFGANQEEQTQKKIFVATFSMLASADGKVSKDEVKIIDRFMKNVLGLDDARRSFAIDVFNQARREEVAFSEYAKQYRELLSDKPKMLEWMVDVLLRISCADECFSDPEQAIVKSACEVFGVSETRYQQLRSKYLKGEQDSNQSAESPLNTADSPRSEAASGSSSAWSVLGLTAEATDEEIVTRHKKLSTEYSPSRIIEFGLPHEFVELAEEKFREIQEAFRAIKSERGL